MQAFFTKLLRMFLDTIHKFVEGGYYEDLFSKYFSVAGFLVGLAFVVLVYFSSADDERNVGFFKVLPYIALINSCFILSNWMETGFHQGLQYDHWEALLNAPNNIISGFVLTLVVKSCYEEYGWRAFLFGLTTYAAMPLLNFDRMARIFNTPLFYQIIANALLAGAVCAIICYRKYFYTSWIWYYAYHVLTRIIAYFMPMIFGRGGRRFLYSLHGAAKFFSQFIMEAIIFAVILIFAIIFEKGVLGLKRRKRV